MFAINAAVSRQMQFANAPEGNGVKPVQAVLDRVARQAGDLRVQGVDVNVVDVHQQAAAGAPRQLGQEVGLGEQRAGWTRCPIAGRVALETHPRSVHGGAGCTRFGFLFRNRHQQGRLEAQISRQVLHHERALQALLHALHVGAQHVQRFRAERDGQQVRRMHHAVAWIFARNSARHTTGRVTQVATRCNAQQPPRKAGVVADAHRFNLLHQPRQLVQVPVVNADGRTQRQADAVQADGVAGAALSQHRQCRAARGKKVL